MALPSVAGRSGQQSRLGFMPPPFRPSRLARAFSSSSSSSSSSPEKTGDCPLPFDVLPYSAAEVKVSNKRQQNMDDEDFLQNLRLSLNFWKKNDYNSAWVHIPVTRASLVEALASKNKDSKDGGFGFDLHHTNSTEQTIVMKKWLRDEAEDKIPPFATHQVGCAGFVLNDQNEILVIKEWSGSPSNRTPTKMWKLPGGLLDLGESFEEAACREVEEETGIPCEFESILAFWHRHELTFGKSDLYYVCLLKPKSLDIKIDPVEVSQARWMSVDDFIRTQDHPLINHVLRNNFYVDETKEVGNSKRIVPSAEMKPGAVQFQNRPPYPTYTPVLLT